LSNKTILFADDSATMRTIMEKTFLAEPFDVVVVPSGEAAISKAREMRPDVIIVDAGLAGVSGYDVCQAVREEATISNTPLLIMSGVSNQYDEARGEAVGVDEHFKKPFDTAQLIEKVAMLSERAPSAVEPVAEPEPLEEPPALDDVSVSDRLSQLDAPLEEVSGVVEAVAHVELIEESPLDVVEDIPLEPVEDIPMAEPEPDVLPEQPERPEAVVEAIERKPAVEPRRPSKETWDFPRPSEASESVTKAEEAPAAIELPKPSPRVVEEPELMEEPSVEFAIDDEEKAIGEEQPIATSESEESVAPEPEVAPIEIEETDATDASGSFQVGTLAELAQMSNEGEPIAPEAHDAPIELSPTPAEADDYAIEQTVRTQVESAAQEVAERVEGVTPAQAEQIKTLTKEVIEQVVWEVVPDLAETIIKEEIAKLLKE
jgi:CheY-like chemotaxis protein